MNAEQHHELVKDKRRLPKSPEHRAKIKAAVQESWTARSIATADARFAGRVSVQSSECWKWTGGKDKDGYGYFSYCGKTIKAHRWAYERWIGPIAEGLVLDHICCNPSCVNPKHLRIGEGLAAQNARKTHCPHGHEFTIENTYLYKGHRHCRACRGASFATLPARRGGLR